MLIILLPLPGIQCYSASDVAVLWCVGVLVSSQACSVGRAACEEGSSKGIVERVIMLIILLPLPGIQCYSASDVAVLWCVGVLVSFSGVFNGPCCVRRDHLKESSKGSSC